MQFTTKIPIPKSHFPIDYHSKIVALGSCFAVNMSDKFDDYQFQNTANPFGILFHPLAIYEIIRRSIQEDFFSESELFFHNERWHSFDVHSDLSSDQKEILLQKLHQLLVDFKTQITSASHILITYGTAWVYKEKASQKIVANCHKVPQSQFEKELLSATKIQEAIQDTMALIQSVNPHAHLIFTVSPVRHLKDGFVENQQSKSNLIIGIHQTLKAQQSAHSYFPSYEIMMDELRDYRFYAEDLLHPNNTAVQYIWERFSESNIAEDAYSVMREVESIQKGLQHKPFHADSQSHQLFVSQLQEKIRNLQKRFPQMHF